MCCNRWMYGLPSRGCTSKPSPTATRLPPSSCAKAGARAWKRTLPKWPPTLRGLAAAHVPPDDAFHRSLSAAMSPPRSGRCASCDSGRSPGRTRPSADIVARILDPGSKLATARGLAEATARDSLAETLGLEDCDEDDLYGQKRRDAIERRLAKRHLKDGALVLYDLTSVWLEGRHCPLGRRGYSRDGTRSSSGCCATARAVRWRWRCSTATPRTRPPSRQAQAPLRVLQGGAGGRPRD